LNTQRFKIFPIDGVSDVHNFKHVGVFWFLICGLVQVLFLSLVVNF